MVMVIIIIIMSIRHNIKSTLRASEWTSLLLSHTRTVTPSTSTTTMTTTAVSRRTLTRGIILIVATILGLEQVHGAIDFFPRGAAVAGSVGGSGARLGFEDVDAGGLVC